MAAEQTPKTILLLEDQPLVRAGMKLLLHLAEPGSRICEAGSYEDAVAQMDAVTFDFAFVDIDLRAEKSGLDVLALFRERHSDTRVVMLSANDDRDMVMSCISAGASGYIPKSTEDSVIFRKAIETVMADGIFLPASILGNGGHSPLYSESRVQGKTAQALGLSDRLCEVLFYLCQGLPNKAIANKMGIAEGTVRKNYVSELLSFFKVARRTELMIEVSRRQIKVLPPQLHVRAHASHAHADDHVSPR